MGKQSVTNYAEIFGLINKLKNSIQDNPEAQKLIVKLEKAYVKHLSSSQTTTSEKKDVYKIATILLQLERIAEDHWQEIKEFFK